MQQIRWCVGNAADRRDAISRQFFAGSRPNIQKVASGERPYQGLVVFRSNQRNSVRFLVVAAQLGKDFVPGDADGNGEPDFLFDSPAQFFSNDAPLFQGHTRLREIQPGFVKAKGFYVGGILQIDAAHQL